VSSRNFIPDLADLAGIFHPREVTLWRLTEEVLYAFSEAKSWSVDHEHR
jgi:hypothetical protein